MILLPDLFTVRRKYTNREMASLKLEFRWSLSQLRCDSFPCDWNHPQWLQWGRMKELLSLWEQCQLGVTDPHLYCYLLSSCGLFLLVSIGALSLEVSALAHQAVLYNRMSCDLTHVVTPVEVSSKYTFDLSIYGSF